jgi:copper chaperone
MGALIMAPFEEMTMIEIKVPDMTCGHCVSTISNAVKELDPTARIDVSLADHLVRVESKASREAILHSIVEAGYSPQPA